MIRSGRISTHYIPVSLLILFLAFILSSCENSQPLTRKSLLSRSSLIAIRPLRNFGAKDSANPPNYADTIAWLVHHNNNKKVDVFFVHPTTYVSPMNWNMPINDSFAIKMIYKWSIQSQLGVFEEYCNTYVPNYRQATFYSFFTKSANGKKALNLATEDIHKAWNYYLKHINKNRPIILAGHSQGSMIILRLLPEIMKDSALSKRIVAIYAIGWPIGKKYLKQNPKIKVCENAKQTGCLISWNTEARDAKGSLVDKPSISVNPLNWSTNEDFVPKDSNIGAVFFHFNSPPDTIIHYVGAQNVNGHLKVTPIPNKLEIRLTIALGIYHIYDYNMFYLNFKNNVKERIDSYFKLPAQE